MGTRIGSKIYQPVPGFILFKCPGCAANHGAGLRGSPGWSWNGDGDKPTITPALVVPMVCHAVVTDGMIAFAAESTHALAGQTVALPDWPEGDEE